MKNVLILERSNQNLKKVSQKGKTVLEGVFAEFGVENRNGRVYEENEYLPHLEYLKKDIQGGSLLGELDHPERFEVALGNVSHRVTDLWYDQGNRQIKGRIEILEGTPKGQIAKSLLEAGVPLSISSRAAGTVNDDKTVSIQQIYTYDLVAKPGFEKAQLETVNESARARISNQIQQINESYNKFEKNHDNLALTLGIVNEQVSIYDLTDKYPSVKLREEAKELVKNKSEQKMEKVNEESIQQWTIYFKNELSKAQDRLAAIENAILENGSSKDVKMLKEEIKKLKGLQEKHQKWTGNIAKNVNKVATHSQQVAEKSNEHYKLTKKISEAVDYNAKVLNYTQDWVGHNANVTNAIAETVDHNATMLNGINEWNSDLAKGINALHEWGTEKAKAINDMHEWTSSIAKGLNTTTKWSEDMIGRAMSKADAKKLLDYIELVSESKANPELRKKLDEILAINSITKKPLNERLKNRRIFEDLSDEDLEGAEQINLSNSFNNRYKLRDGRMVDVMPDGSYREVSDDIEQPIEISDSEAQGAELIPCDDPLVNCYRLKDGRLIKVYPDGSQKLLVESLTSIKGLKGLGIITDAKTIGNHKVNTDAGKDGSVQFDQKYKTIVAKMKKASKVGGGKPKQLKTIESSGGSQKMGASTKVKGIMVLDTQKNGSKPAVKITGDGPTQTIVKGQNLKLDTKPVGKLKESILTRKSKLDEKLGVIIEGLEKEKRLDEEITKRYPFLSLLHESERKMFRELDAAKKERVAQEIAKKPTTDVSIIRNLWESALREEKDETPLWLKAAPKKYKELYENASDIQKSAINARAEFYPLETQYQINNFWETSGLSNRPSITLNEAVIAKTPEESDKKLDSFVASIGEAMKKYNS